MSSPMRIATGREQALGIYNTAYRNGCRTTPEEEAILANDPMYSHFYAAEVVKGRFEEGEDAIATESFYAYNYAKDVIKGRFKKGEDAMSTDQEYAFFYAMGILKGRFEKGEDAILCGPKFRSAEYIKILITNLRKRRKK